MRPAFNLLFVALVAAALHPSCARAWPFLGSSSGSGSQRALLQEGQSYFIAPGAAPEAPGIGSFMLPPGGISARCNYFPPLCNGSETSPTWVQLFTLLKDMVSPDEDICYWSWASLPPPGASLEQYDFESVPEEAELVQDLSYASYERLSMQAVAETCTYGCGLVEWAGLTLGSDLTQYLCATNYTADPDLCTELHMYQEWRWPTASSIFRLNGTNTQQLEDMLRWWRRSQEGHLPTMSSQAINRGWGMNGVTAAKIFKCDDIPEEFRTTEYPPPLLSAPTATGLPLTSEALEFWSATPGLTFPGYSG